jgi:hypothetical protein
MVAFAAALAPRSPASPASPASVQVREAIGLIAASQRLKQATPTGRGIRLGHVEGNPGSYLPHLAHPAFSDVRSRLRSGPSAVNPHADGTARLFYGREGLAPGATEVDHFTSGGWLGPEFLRVGSSLPPAGDPIQVFSHSWVSLKPLLVDDEALRRIDFIIDERDALVVVGVNNGERTAVPPLLASGYNAIAVGQWNGRSSGGYTVVGVPGRCKPDLVGPLDFTSHATPVVAAFAARLLEAAQLMPQPNAARAEVIKACLMAGATKPADWSRDPGKPLDAHLGAGRVHLDRSLRILEAGAQAPGAVRAEAGWAFAPVFRGGRAAYAFTLTQPVEFSAVLTWHRRIDGQTVADEVTGLPRWSGAPSLSDFNLALRRHEDALDLTAAQSLSDIDNVEHIYLDVLPAGRYTLELWREDSLPEFWDYALAWIAGPVRPLSRPKP